MKLLTIGNPKTRLGESYGYLTGILHLNPEVTNKLCPYASPGCRALCLNRSGRAEIFKTVLSARTRKTLMFLNDREKFLALLHKDIIALRLKAECMGLKPAIRLNGTSDILWERYIDLTKYPDVQFYDYTKIPVHFRKVPANYYLTFSRSENNHAHVEHALNSGVNVAVVFNAKDLPSHYMGHEVIDGLEHDLRFLDKANVIVGLLPKGRRARRNAKHPFFVQI